MATIVNRRRGTTAQHAAFTGAIGETTYDTDIKRLVAHDGAQAGGFPAAHLHVNNLFSIQQRITSTANAPQLILTTAPAQSTQAFQIFQPDGTTQLFGVNFSGTLETYRQSADTSGAAFSHFKRGTTGSATAAVASGDQLSQDNYFGWTGAAFAASAQIRVSAREAFTPTTLGSQFEFRTPAIGSTVQTLVATLNTSLFEISSRLLLPNTTSATVGGIYFGGNRAFHNFGTSNTFAGVNAGNLTMTGADNSFFGTNAGFANTTGGNNSFFGRYAGQANTTGFYNSFFGRSAGLFNTAGTYNSFFGANAGLFNTTGTSNTFFGGSAGQSNSTGASNSFFGRNAGFSNTTGTSNTFFGRSAGEANTVGVSNSFFGHYSGTANTTGGSNVFFGRSAGAANTTASNNSFFGFNAGLVNTTGANNVFLGFLAGDNLTTGSNNLVFGANIDSPTATNSNTMTIGNLIFGTGVDGTGTTISSGLVGVKVVTPVTDFHVVTTSAADPRGIMSAQHSTDAIGARIHFRKSRGTATAPTTVVTGDVLGRLRFSGYDSANYLQMGSIDVVSVGTIAATRVPTYMAFSTATDATPSVLTERLRIDQAGKIQILTGVGNDAGGFKHARVTTGSVGAGSTALVTITWTTAFADANYTVNASVLDSTTSSLSLSVVHIESITSAAVTVRVLNNAVGSLTGTVHVIAVHD